jgi:hydroxylamine reductase
MFCYQCQETAMGTGCTLKGVCGKTSEVANLQDLLLFVIRGIAVYNEHLRKEGHSSEEADKFIYDSLFITITNANFDKAAIIGKIKEGLRSGGASHTRRRHPFVKRTGALRTERNGSLCRART